MVLLKTIMKHNITFDLWPKVLSYLTRQLRWIGSIIIPPQKTKPYNFGAAKEYWHNVPRAKGATPFNTERLKYVSTRDLAKEFDKEMDIARKKEERKVGFALSLDSISSINLPEVMDYGSGIGFYGFEIMDRHPGSRVTFVDINETNLATVKRIAKHKNLTERVSCVVVNDKHAHDISFKQSFHLIVSMGVLHHTPHAPEIVKHLSQFLRNDGIFQVMLYNDNYLHHKEKIAGRRLNEAGFGALTDPAYGKTRNPYSEAYDDAKAKRLFQGYEIISAHYPTPFYNIYRFKKTSETFPSNVTPHAEDSP